MSRSFALFSVAACAIIWGTTWFAITLQLGTVDNIVSIAARFGLAAAVLFGFCMVTRQSLRLTRNQHLACMGHGLFAFALSYGFVYAAEESVASAIVAVLFAALAILNLTLFRIIEKQKASLATWGGAVLGATGVAVLSLGQVMSGAPMGEAPVLGMVLGLLAVSATAVSNWFAWKGQQAQAPVMPATAWAMAYGTLALVVFGLVTGVDWRIEMTPAYIGSLLYLSIMGSVVAFALYFNLARHRGYTLVSYISALTPPIAMLVSIAFEGARFGIEAVIGLALVMAGQYLVIRKPKET